MSIVFWACAFATALLIPSLAMVAWRLLYGPSAADRVIATDMIGLLGIAVGAVACGITGHTAYLDIGVGIGLFSFLGAVAFAALLESRPASQPEPEPEYDD